MNSNATYVIDTRTKEQIEADQIQWIKEDVSRIRTQIRSLKKLPLPVTLENIASYFTYWQKYHIHFDYNDYTEDFSFPAFLNKLRKGYKQAKLKLLNQELDKCKENLHERS